MQQLSERRRHPGGKWLTRLLSLMALCSVRTSNSPCRFFGKQIPATGGISGIRLAGIASGHFEGSAGKYPAIPARAGNS
jgi:hypothetical protein